jgi:hypothetical protein
MQVRGLVNEVSIPFTAANSVRLPAAFDCVLKWWLRHADGIRPDRDSNIH